MMTLPANSTFLPVLDDLLSPDFRPVLLPAQTPQTPTDIVSFGGGKIITNAYGNITFAANSLSKSIIFEKLNSGGGGSGSGSPCPGVPVSILSTGKDKQKTVRNNVGPAPDTDKVDSQSDAEAAAKIQSWWKSKRSNSFDVRAERIKHSIRHSRTEDHIRYLESEVSRLKTALSSERKIRSLQLEAIRSLWSQVQRISTAESANSSLMTRSVPNGLPKDHDLTTTSPDTVMSMSLNTALETAPPTTGKSECNSAQTQNSQETTTTTVTTVTCSCSKEVQNLRESLTHEIGQLRTMIDQLTLKENFHDSRSSQAHEDLSSGESQSNDSTKLQQQQQKRPLSLNLVGVANNNNSNSESSESQLQDKEKHTTEEEKEQIVDYANQMASKLVDDAVEDKDKTKEQS